MFYYQFKAFKKTNEALTHKFYYGSNKDRNLNKGITTFKINVINNLYFISFIKTNLNKRTISRKK